MMPNFQPRNANIRSSWWNISRHISIHLSILVGEVTILDGKTMLNPAFLTSNASEAHEIHGERQVSPIQPRRVGLLPGT